MKRKKEIPINGVGIIDGYKVMAKKFDYRMDCSDCCVFSGSYPFPCPNHLCHAKHRTDKTHVYFVEVKEGIDNENT